LQSSLVTVKPGTKSLLIESKVTGEENRLNFADAALALGENTGMIELVYDDDETIVDIRHLNAVSVAQDTIVAMEGIEVYRPSNEISDLIPGLTITAKEISSRPVRLTIETDNEAVKDAIITMVGNYNRLMAELNVLTRRDEKVIDEISYLSNEERDEYRKRLGAFSGDSTLQQLRTTLLRIVSTPYPTSLEQDLSLLAQIGIGADIRRSGGADPSQLRGYLEIDEKILDSAISTKLAAIKELFGSDTTGDLLVNTGVAYNLEALTKPYVELGGLFAFKMNSMNSRIDQEKTRIVNMDRQLAAKEADLKKQYGQMEGAYTRMEQMSTSFERFQQQNNNNSR
jgi:flagellar hook-associated protein 2